MNMANGKCESCGCPVDSKYKYCLPCMKKWKEDNSTETPVGDSSDICGKLDRIADSLDKLVEVLHFSNWNLGSISAVMRGDEELLKKLKKDKYARQKDE